MQKNVKTEFKGAEKSQNRHNLKILNERSNGWKFASFEGTYFYLTPLFYKYLGKKKAPLRMPILSYSSEKKVRF